MTKLTSRILPVSFSIVLILSLVMSFRIHRLSSINRNLRSKSFITQSILNRQMSMNSDGTNFFITTPIYYVNGEPHLGHAYTSVISDVIARYNRADGKNVYFLTGTDEHGLKVEQSARTVNKSPIEFADEISQKFRDLVTKLGCSNDDFIRTTEERHKEAVRALWNTLEQNGYIYLGSYEGWYSVRDETFYTESELTNGKAPTGAEVQWLKEESYFFRLSNFTQKLLDFYENNPDFIAPKTRRSEVVSFVAQPGGLRDLSISRTSCSWGIKVPNNDNHVIYVWLDALANYISALGYPNMESEKMKNFWPADLHLVGKDILRFHAVFWPAFLMAAGIPTPKRVFAHGWWTKDGEKMSKSLGNVLDPFELLQMYGVDYVRYYLITEIVLGNDGDFSHEVFCRRINSDLADDIGNLAQRVLTLVHKHCDGIIPVCSNDSLQESELELLRYSKERLNILRNHLSKQSMREMCEEALSISKLGNKYITQQAPWVTAKEIQQTDDPEKKRELQGRLHAVLYTLSETIRHAGILLSPVMPDSCTRLLDSFGIPPELRTFNSITEDSIPNGLKVTIPTPIFPRIVSVVESDNMEKNGSPPPKAKSDKNNKNENQKNNHSLNPETVAFLNSKYPSTLSAAELAQYSNSVGEAIRSLKAALKEDNDDFKKSEVKRLVQELNYLKSRTQT